MAETHGAPVSGKKFAVGALIVVAIVLVIAIVAGSRDERSNRIKGNDLAMAQFEGFRDQICQCEDRLCRREVLERMDKFQQASREEIQAMSRDQRARVDEIFNEIERCVKAKASTNDPGAQL